MTSTQIFPSEEIPEETKKKIKAFSHRLLETFEESGLQPVWIIGAIGIAMQIMAYELAALSGNDIKDAKEVVMNIMGAGMASVMDSMDVDGMTEQ